MANPETVIEDETGIIVKGRFAHLADELSQAETDLTLAKAAWQRARAMDGQRNEMVLIGQANAGAIASPVDPELRRQIESFEARLRSSSSLARRGTRMLEESLAALKRRAEAERRITVDAALRYYQESTRQAYLLAETRVRELQRKYDEQLNFVKLVGSKISEFAVLKEAYDRTARTCDMLDERIKEVNLSDNVGAMNVSIIEVAEPSRVASHPQRPKVISFGIAAGLVLALGLVWLRDFLDHRLRSIEEIASVVQLPILGVLPHLGSRYNRVAAGLIVANQRRSVMAEAVRTLRTAIHFGFTDPSPCVILVTSPAPGDGKSTVASGLAIAMAQADQSVLLIDADFRKPLQHTVFSLPNESGMSTVMSERRMPDMEILPSSIASLDVLPCGPAPPNPVELLNNGFITTLLQGLRERYDKIIIDSAPIMPVADSRILAAVADATVLVLRAGKSSRGLSLGARNELWRVRAQQVGVVVNAAPQKKREGYGYGYGYSGYGDKNGSGGNGAAYELPAQNGRSRVGLPSDGKFSASGELIAGEYP